MSQEELQALLKCQVHEREMYCGAQRDLIFICNNRGKHPLGSSVSDPFHYTDPDP